MTLNITPDNREWVVLINRHMTDSLVADMKKDFNKYLSHWFPLHIETIDEYRSRPSYKWELYKKGLTTEEAYNFCRTDEYVLLAIDILSENGIQLPVKQKNNAIDSRQHGQSWKSIRFNVMKRDNYKCQICGKTAIDGAKLEVDHKKALANGGNNAIENLWTLCFDCNRGKRTKDLS